MGIAEAGTSKNDEVSQSDMVEGGKRIIKKRNTTLTFEQAEVLDIVSSRKTAIRSAASIIIEENGENIKLVFINFTENLLSKWEKGGETAYAFRIVEPEPKMFFSENGENIGQEYEKIEVYYINQLISEINPEKDYVQLKNKRQFDMEWDS